MRWCRGRRGLSAPDRVSSSEPTTATGTWSPDHGHLNPFVFDHTKSFRVDEHVPEAAGERYRRLQAYQRLRCGRLQRGRRPGATGDQPIARCTAGRPSWPQAVCTPWRRIRAARAGTGVRPIRRKYPFMGKARVQVLLGREGVGTECVERRAHPQPGAGPRCDPARRVLRRQACAEAPAPLRPLGTALEVRREGAYPGRADADRPHDLCARRRHRQGVPRRVPGVEVHGHARLLTGHCRARSALPARTAGRPCRSRSSPSRSTAAASSWPASRRPVEALHIPLHVLPPKHPQYNGCVERANRAARIEFWGRYDGPLSIDPVQAALAGYVVLLTTMNAPTQHSTRKTPNEYLVNPGGRAETVP